MPAEDEAVSAVVRVSSEMVKSTADIVRFILMLLMGRQGYGRGGRGLLAATKNGVMSLGRGAVGAIDYGMGAMDGHGSRGEISWRRALRFPDADQFAVSSELIGDTDRIELLREQMATFGVTFAIRRSELTGDYVIAYRAKDRELLKCCVSPLLRMWAEARGVDPEDDAAVSERMAADTEGPAEPDFPFDPQPSPTPEDVSEAAGHARRVERETVAGVAQWGIMLALVSYAGTWDSLRGIPEGSRGRQAELMAQVEAKTGIGPQDVAALAKLCKAGQLTDALLSRYACKASVAEIWELVSSEKFQAVQQWASAFGGQEQRRDTTVRDASAREEPSRQPAEGDPVAESRPPHEVADAVRQAEGMGARSQDDGRSHRYHDPFGEPSGAAGFRDPFDDRGRQWTVGRPQGQDGHVAGGAGPATARQMGYINDLLNDDEDGTLRPLYEDMMAKAGGHPTVLDANELLNSPEAQVVGSRRLDIGGAGRGGWRPGAPGQAADVPGWDDGMPVDAYDDVDLSGVDAGWGQSL